MYGRWYHTYMHKTTLYLPPHLQDALRDAARRFGRPQAELVREALERYLEVLPSPTFLSMGIADDGRVPARDSEEWIRTRWKKRGP